MEYYVNMSTNLNINITQGCSFLYIFNTTDSYGNLINLSGFNAYGYVKSDYDDCRILLDLNPTVIEPMISGLVLISCNNQQAILPVGVYQYDIEVFDGTTTYPVAYGDLIVNPSTAFRFNSHFDFYGRNNLFGFLQSGTNIDFGTGLCHDNYI